MKFLVLLSIVYLANCDTVTTTIASTASTSTTVTVPSTTTPQNVAAPNEAAVFLTRFYAALNIQDYSVINQAFTAIIAGQTYTRDKYIYALQVLQSQNPAVFNNPEINASNYNAVKTANNLVISYTNGEKWTVEGATLIKLESQ
ncbi:unnamed protein product [Caenorhabditis angaria]|uniref:Uncharacterized protein n=1 Tax=Caenorhabditis angaria TaxID=860376 RepID=A0A9P1N7I5_9PELO|nr:unnamed protein product [Caenorhabditis angaria]